MDEGSRNRVTVSTVWYRCGTCLVVYSGSFETFFIIYPILDEMMKSWLHSVKIWKCQSANQSLEQHASHAT